MKFLSENKKIYYNGGVVYDLDSVKVSEVSKWSKTTYDENHDLKINYLQVSDNFRINIFKSGDYYCIFKNQRIKVRKYIINDWIKNKFVGTLFFNSCITLLNRLSKYYDYIVTDLESDNFNENIINSSEIEKIEDKEDLTILFISISDNNLIKSVYNTKKIIYNCVLIRLFE